MPSVGIYDLVGLHDAVSDFGLKGDGKFDNTNALVRAITAVNAEGSGALWFRPGTYLIESVASLPAGYKTRLRGVGSWLTTLKSAGDGKVLTATHTHLTSEWGCSVSGMTLDGGGGAGPVVNFNGMTLFAMDDVVIRNTSGTGLQLVSVYDSNFRNVYLEAAGSATAPVVVLDCNATGTDSLNDLRFYGLHVEPGDIDTIMVDLVGNSTNNISGVQFYGLKVHGNPTSCNPARPLVRVGQYAPGTQFYGGIVAYGKGTSQVELTGDRCLLIGQEFGIGATVPQVAVDFKGSRSKVISPNMLNATYSTAYTRVATGCIHNIVEDPKVGSVAIPVMSDAGARSMVRYNDPSAGAIGSVNINGDGWAFTSGALLPAASANGFLYIPTINGTPTGTPTSLTGGVPFAFDVVGLKLWVYTGTAWKGVLLA